MSTTKFKYYQTENSSPVKSYGGRKNYGAKYSTENKRNSNASTKKNASESIKIYNTTENHYEGDYQEESENGDYGHNETLTRPEENHEEVSRMEAKSDEVQNEDPKFSNNVYEQYNNLPQENENELDFEEEQGREVIVENVES